MSRKPILSSIALATIIATTLLTTDSEAHVDVWVHGSVCRAMTDYQADELGHNRYGVHNLSTTLTLKAICPLATETTSSSAIFANVLDRDTNDSVVVEWCSVDVTGTTQLCNQASTSIAGTGSDSLILSDPGPSLFRYATVRLPKRTALGVSHLTTIMRSGT